MSSDSSDDYEGGGAVTASDEEEDGRESMVTATAPTHSVATARNVKARRNFRRM